MPATRARTALLVTLLIASTLLASCGLDQKRYRWEKALLTADRYVDHEEYEAAQRAYEELAPTAPRPEFARYIQYRLAYLEELRGNYAEALSAYEPLWSKGDKDEYASRSLFRSGMIFYEKLGRQEEGVAVFERILSALPESPSAKNALLEILGHYRKQGDLPGALAFLDARYVLLEKTPIGDNITLRKAQLHRELGQHEEAIAAYGRLMKRHRASGLYDDAHWELATLYEDLGRFEDALTQLRLITEDQDSSWYVGSYDSQYVDDARFRRGMILLDRLDRFEEAAEEFGLFASEFDQSMLRDDARWNIVQARLGANDAEEAEEACEDLADAEPESRWVDDCERLVAALRSGKSAVSLRTKAVD